MAGATEAWRDGDSDTTIGNPYASGSTSMFPEFSSDTPDIPEPFNELEQDDHSVLREIYREIMEIKNNVALLRTELNDHVLDSATKHGEYRTQFNGAAAQLGIVQRLVERIVDGNIAAPANATPAGPASAGPAPAGPAPLPPVPPVPPRLGAQKLKMATPKVFNGKKEESTTFQVNCNMYIQGTAPNATEDQKVNAVISYMEGEAWEWLQVYLEWDLNNRVHWLHDLAAFWVEFQGRFGEIDKEDKNRAKFSKLKQTGSIQDYQRDFQKYATGLNYGDHALRDKFYEGLNDDVKKMMITQMFDPFNAAATLQSVAVRANQIYNKLQLLKPLEKSHTVNKSSNVPTTVPSAPSTPRAPRERLNVGDNVYMIGQDGRAKKGKITSEGRNSRGAVTPTVKWSTGESSAVPYPALKKDSRPVTMPSTPAKLDPKGPGPMELDGRGRPQVTCNSCGGKGHFARVCPSRPMSGHAAEVGEEKLIELDSDDEESGKGDAKTQ